MQTKKFLSLLLALAMMFSLSVTASAAEEEGKSLEGSIVILHTNDVHGGIAGYAKVAALKAEYQPRALTPCCWTPAISSRAIPPSASARARPPLS